LSRAARHPPIILSAEFRLMLECCRWSFAGCHEIDLEELCTSINWAPFLRLARFHRVQGLVWKCLKSIDANVPCEIGAALANDGRAIAAANLFQSAEARELCSAFEHEGVPILFVKGLSVGALAYGDPVVKMGWDIDILIAPADLHRAAAELTKRDYSPALPKAVAELTRWHSHAKESVWRRPRDNLHVELHTRLADNPRLIPRIGLCSPRRHVDILPRISLPTLADDELVAYLCVHGASSLWFRAKWITDLAAILHRLGARKIEHLYKRSLELGAGRASALAFLHADDLYGTLAGTGLRERLEQDPVSRRLAHWALRQVGGTGEPREPTRSPFGTFRIHLSQFFLVRGLRFKIGELRRQARESLSQFALQERP
jgi:hypothetical protein